MNICYIGEGEGGGGLLVLRKSLNSDRDSNRNSHRIEENDTAISE